MARLQLESSSNLAAMCTAARRRCFSCLHLTCHLPLYAAPQASLLLPTGAWQALAETVRMRARVWLSCCWPSSGGGRKTEPSTRINSVESLGADGKGVDSSGSSSKELGCGVTGAAAEALQAAGRHAAGSAVATVGTAAHAAAAGLSALPGAAAVHGGAVAAASAAQSLAGAAVWVEERIRLSLVGVMLLLVWLPNQVLIILLTTKIVGLRQCEFIFGVFLHSWGGRGRGGAGGRSGRAGLQLFDSVRAATLDACSRGVCLRSSCGGPRCLSVLLRIQTGQSPTC